MQIDQYYFDGAKLWDQNYGENITGENITFAEARAMIHEYSEQLRDNWWAEHPISDSDRKPTEAENNMFQQKQQHCRDKLDRLELAEIIGRVKPKSVRDELLNYHSGFRKNQGV